MDRQTSLEQVDQGGVAEEGSIVDSGQRLRQMVFNLLPAFLKRVRIGGVDVRGKTEAFDPNGRNTP
jgi:hypothetical protein